MIQFLLAGTERERERREKKKEKYQSDLYIRSFGFNLNLLVVSLVVKHTEPKINKIKNYNN